MDAYQTITQQTEGEYKEKGSKFIAFAFPTDSEEDAKKHLDEIRRMHHKARHHCWGYRLGLLNSVEKSSDDGEPSGTAGPPILGQIKKFDLHNVIVVVVRYFGGVKLGTGGLIRAYKTAAADALEKAVFVMRDIEVGFVCKCPVTHTHKILQFVGRSEHISMINQHYEVEFMSIVFTCPVKFEQQMLHELKCSILGYPVSSGDIPPLPENVTIEKNSVT